MVQSVSASYVAQEKTHQFTKFIENVKSQQVLQEEDGIAKEKNSTQNYNIESMVPRVYQSCKRELMTMNNGKSLPKGFDHFVNTPLCSEMIQSILDYIKFLLKLDKKKQQLEQDAKFRGIIAPKVLRSETDKLQLKAKRMGDNYLKLIFTYRSIGNSEFGVDENINGFIKFKSVIQNNAKNDQAFYKSVVRLFGKVLAECFERSDLPMVIIELERLFKTNMFNESQRSQERAAMEEQYPELRDFTQQELNVNHQKEEQMRPIRHRIEQRMQLKRKLNVLPNQKFNIKPAYSPRGEIRPLFVNLTAHTAAKGRSPLISLMFPTIKDKVTKIEITKVINPTELKDMEPEFLAGSELEAMVKHETRSRHQRHYSTIR